MIQLSKKQLELMLLLADEVSEEILYGGAAGGAKTWAGCEWLLWACMAYPGTRWFIGRQHLTEIRESTIQTMFKVFAKHGIHAGLYKYDDQKVKITFACGSTIKGLEMMYKPSDPDFDTFGSTEYTGGWIEEGGGIAAKAKEIASTRIGRHHNDKYGIMGKLLITGNPARNWMYYDFYKPWKDGKLAKRRKFIRSLVSDNPFRETGYEDRLKGLKGASRARLYAGDWEYNDDPLSLCENECISDLFSNDFLTPNELDKKIIVDVAMGGVDRMIIAVFYGGVLVDYIVMKKSGGNQILQGVKMMQAKHGIAASRIVYDADGVGSFLGGQGGFIPGAIAFHGGAQPFKEKDERGKELQSEYAHLKDQCGYILAAKVNDGQLWLKCVHLQEDVESITEEVEQLKADEANTDGKLKLMPKKEIAAIIGRSPDWLDILLMSCYFDARKMAAKKSTYQRKLNAF